MIIEVKTVEILAKQKMQFEATTVVKEIGRASGRERV